MKVKDLIEKKDYDYIEWYVTPPNGLWQENIFFGISKSENGKLISLDGDTYSENTEVISYEEWNNPEKNILNGLTIVYKGELLQGEGQKYSVEVHEKFKADSRGNLIDEKEALKCKNDYAQLIEDNQVIDVYVVE